MKRDKQTDRTEAYR